jgi:hypothetical protein
MVYYGKDILCKERNMKRLKDTIMVIIAVLVAGLFVIGCSNNDEKQNGTIPNDTVKVQGNLLILQAYGNAGEGSPGGVSHSFVELYNISDKAINLSGISLYYADGIRGENVTEDAPWQKIALTGSIPAKGSFLILGKKHDDLSGTRYKITDGYGDINNNDLTLSRRGFKVALIKGSASLTVQNPFTAGSGGKPISGYIDMVGSLNDPNASPPDHIFGYETAPARNSASEAVRRADLKDYDNNSTDFIAARYASTGAGAFTNEMLEVRKPRNSKAGAWSPFAEPAPPTISENTLLIFQVFGMHADNDSAPTHSFIELYNNSNAAVDLSTYSVHWANGLSTSTNAPAEKDVWHKIDLSGNIPAKGSYLILGKQVVDAAIIADVSTNGRLDLTAVTADINAPTFLMSNRSYKVALMSNQNAISVANPWGNAACIDLVSAINTAGTDSVTAAKGDADLNAVNAASGGANTISKQKSYRRTSLTVIDVTLTDFTTKQYSTISADEIEKFRPRTAAETASGYTPQF